MLPAVRTVPDTELVLPNIHCMYIHVYVLAFTVYLHHDALPHFKDGETETECP